MLVDIRQDLRQIWNVPAKTAISSLAAPSAGME